MEITNVPQKEEYLMSGDLVGLFLGDSGSLFQWSSRMEKSH